MSIEDKSLVGVWAQGVLSALYVASPLDVIPDIVPGAGYVDDAIIVVLFVLRVLLFVRAKSLPDD